MGGNICKNCHGYSQKEEQDMSESLINQQNNEYTKLFKNSRATFQTTVKIPESSINNESINKSISKSKDIEVESKLKILIRVFRKLKKMKDEAHKIITLRENLKEKRNLIIPEGDESLNVDLFPALNYNYLGNIFQEKEDGFGIQYFPKSNAKYVGYFRNGRRIDFCLFEDKSKFYTYKGQTKNNFTGIYGIYYNSEKQITYEGEWLNNRKDGIGVELYSDGSKYQGEHKNGVKHGLGVYNWNDGSTYEGEWKFNLMDGYGIYKFKDGSICSGLWVENQLNGFGKLIFPKIKCYVGYFENNYKNGFGISFWFKEKKAFVGFWKNNKQNGLGKFIYNKKIKYGTWKEGAKEKEIEKKEFYYLLNEQKTPNNYLNIFGMDYNGINEYIKNFDDF
jgi:hypothetical protein